MNVNSIVVKNSTRKFFSNCDNDRRDSLSIYLVTFALWLINYVASQASFLRASGMPATSDECR